MSGIEEKIAQAKAAWDAMTPEERKAMVDAQRSSYVLAEAGFGSDADEAAYRDAHRRGGKWEMARLNHEASQRVERARQYLGAEEPKP